MTDPSPAPYRRRRRLLRRSAAAAAGVTVTGLAGTGLMLFGFDQGLLSDSRTGKTATDTADNRPNADPSPAPDSTSDQAICPPPPVGAGPAPGQTRTGQPPAPRYDSGHDGEGGEDEGGEDTVARDAGYHAAAPNVIRNPVVVSPSPTSVPPVCLSPSPPRTGQPQQPSTSQAPSNTSGLGGTGTNQQPPAGGTHGS